MFFAMRFPSGRCCQPLAYANGRSQVSADSRFVSQQWHEQASKRNCCNFRALGFSTHNWAQPGEGLCCGFEVGFTESLASTLGSNVITTKQLESPRHTNPCDFGSVYRAFLHLHELQPLESMAPSRLRGMKELLRTTSIQTSRAEHSEH